MIRVDITDQEIAAYIAEARVRRTSKYPRCDCQGDKALAKKWKKDAASDVCLFIKGQYGKEPSKLDFTDRRAMVRDCKPFLPAAKTAMLTERTGRLPRTFWADFCDDSHEYDDLTDAQALTLDKGASSATQGPSGCYTLSTAAPSVNYLQSAGYPADDVRYSPSKDMKAVDGQPVLDSWGGCEDHGGAAGKSSEPFTRGIIRPVSY